MFRPIEAFIGLRYVRAKSKNSFISFISLISMLGLIVGVSVLITVLSVMNGFEREIKNRVLGFVHQASVVSSERIPNWQTLANQIQQQDANITAIAPFTYVKGMVSNATGEVQTLLVTGIEPTYEKNISIVNDAMIKGNFDSLTTQQYHIVIGKTLADNLAVDVGDKVTLILPEGNQSVAGVVPRYHQFTITGIFKISPQPEKLLAYIPMSTANQILHQPDGAQGIRFKLNDIFSAKQSAMLASQQQANLTAQDWTQSNGNLFGLIRMQKTILALILTLIIVVAVFNLISSLTMVVTEKTSEIAILKTLGTSPKRIVIIFMLQGALIGLIGTAVGAVLGIILSANIGTLSVIVNETFQLNLFDKYYINQLPAKIIWYEVLLVIVISFILCVLATIYPAIKASRIQPVDGLKYD